MVEEAEEVNEFKRKAKIDPFRRSSRARRGCAHILLCGYIFTPKNEHDENTKNIVFVNFS